MACDRARVPLRAEERPGSAASKVVVSSTLSQPTHARDPLPCPLPLTPPRPPSPAPSL